MNKSSGSSSCGGKRKAKRSQKTCEKEGSRPKSQRKSQGLNLDRIFEDEPNIKVAEEEDEVFIIDKDTYIKGTREEPYVLAKQNAREVDSA